MKKSLVMMLLAFLTMTVTTFAQQKKSGVEVLYFKANLACCKARACNALESTVKGIVDQNWTDGSVTFRQVKLTDTSNNELIRKYNAQSQTLVIVKKKKKKTLSVDASSLLQEFVKTNDTTAFKKDFVSKINEVSRF